MSIAATVATRELGRLLRADNGLTMTVAALMSTEERFLDLLGPSEIFDGNLTADLLEKSSSVKYPAIHIYCDRISNKLTEKFRTFSGTADLVVDVRVSHDHPRELHEQLHLYVQAVTDLLDRRRGEWRPGVYYTGGYEVVFQPVKRGGRNFIQTARVQLVLHMSID